MRSNRLYTFLETNPLAIPALFMIFGGIGMYLAEYKQQGAI
jgi:hypothetical protein